jgi:hypothetical protein
MPRAIAPAIARSAWPNPLLGYVTDGAYAATWATRSSVASAEIALLLTNARFGRSTGTCEAIVAAAERSRAASLALPWLGLANAYPATFGIAGTPTFLDTSVLGVSRAVFHPTSGLTGPSAYRDTGRATRSPEARPGRP